MTAYRFVTDWQLDAPRTAVWAVVDDAEQWQRWWPGVEESRALPATDGQRRLAMCFRAALGYTLSFEAVVVRRVPPDCGLARVSGQLEGTARWQLHEQDGGTRLRWTWEVQPHVLWLRVLSPVAGPVFRWAHTRLMRRGHAGLVAQLSGSGARPHRPDR